jgi:hypothetical protein
MESSISLLAETLFQNYHLAVRGSLTHRQAIINIANCDIYKEKVKLYSGTINLVKCASRMLETLEQIDRGEKPRTIIYEQKR